MSAPNKELGVASEVYCESVHSRGGVPNQGSIFASAVTVKPGIG